MTQRVKWDSFVVNHSSVDTVNQWCPLWKQTVTALCQIVSTSIRNNVNFLYLLRNTISLWVLLSFLYFNSRFRRSRSCLVSRIGPKLICSIIINHYNNNSTSNNNTRVWRKKLSEVFSIRIYRQYTTEEGHRSVRKLWSFYYRFIELKCHNYALYFCFVYKYSNTQKPSYATLSHIMPYMYIYIIQQLVNKCRFF